MGFVPALCLAVAGYAAVLVGIATGKVIRTVRDEGTESEEPERNSNRHDNRPLFLADNLPSIPTRPTINLPQINRTIPPLSGIQWENQRLWEIILEQNARNYYTGADSVGVSAPNRQPRPRSGGPENPFAGPGAMAGWRYEDGQPRRL